MKLSNLNDVVELDSLQQEKIEGGYLISYNSASSLRVPFLSDLIEKGVYMLLNYYMFS